MKRRLLPSQRAAARVEWLWHSAQLHVGDVFVVTHIYRLRDLSCKYILRKCKQSTFSAGPQIFASSTSDKQAQAAQDVELCL